MESELKCEVYWLEVRLIYKNYKKKKKGEIPLRQSCPHPLRHLWSMDSLIQFT